MRLSIHYPIITLLLLFTSLNMRGADYVDEINSNSASYAEGHRVIYEMNVGSFTQAGTFAAASDRMEELKALGIDIVWLMPIYPRGTSNSPYAATSFQKTNPAYGTIADLKALVQHAHQLHMEVWLDWVPNHTATNAEWVTTHPEYYAKSGGQMIHPNNYSDVWQLNYNNSDLVNAMNDCLKFWIDQCDVDGYRCDYVSSSYIPTSYWQNAIPLIKNYKSGKTVSFLAETDIAQDVTRLKNAGFDYDYAWAFQSNMQSFGASGNTASRLKAFANNMLNASNSITFSRMLYLTNHDQNFNDGGKTLTQQYGTNRYPLAVLAYTIYGMPMIYNGQEVGGNQILDYFSDTKINWNNKDDKMRNTIRTLAALKHTIPALTDSKTASANPTVEWLTVTNNTAVLAYRRKSGDSEVMVILNFGTSSGNATITGITSGDWSQWLNSESVANGVSRKQVTMNATQTFQLDAKGYRVYVKGVFSEETIEEPSVDTYTPCLDDPNEVSVFLETPIQGTYNVWVWGDLGGGEAYTSKGSWPGDEMELKGKAANGSYIYKYVQTKTQELPSNIIITRFDNGTESKRLWDGVLFTNNGYYVEDADYTSSIPAVITTTTGIRNTTVTTHDDKWYDLNGRQISEPTGHGIYIHGGKKVIR